MNTIRHLFALGLLAALPVLSASAEEPHKFGPPGSWNRTGVWDDDFIYCFRDGWVFPLGTNHLSDIAVWSQGSLFAKHTDWDPFASVGAPLLVIARRSHVSCGPTSSNSYLFAWENCFPDGDTNSPITASIELFRNGHIVVTSNGVVRTTRHVNWFDVDDDGIPDDADPDPQVPDPDGFTRWQTLPEDANPDNYCWIEIVSPYEDALVRFVGDAPSDYSDPYFVARANETNRVPLLIGKAYAVESSVPVALAEKSDPEIEVGIRDGGVTSVCWPAAVALGDSDPGGFSVSVSPSRLVGEYVWTNGCCRLYGGGRFFVYACDSSTCSCGGCRAEGYFGYEGYRPFALTGGECGCRPHEEETHALEFSVSMPTTLFVNNDDDDGNGEADVWQFLVEDNREDDLHRAVVSLSSPTPTGGVVSLVSASGFSGTISDFGGTAEYPEYSLWEISDCQSLEEMLFLNPMAASGSYRGSAITVKWEPEAGPERTATARFTVVEPVVEPVCSETNAVHESDGDHELVLNPSGVVIGKDSYFRIKVDPSDYPDTNICWFAEGPGTVEFPDGNTGRTVRVRGLSGGDVDLTIQIGDCQAARPCFFARVVTNMTVKVSAWIVADRDGKVPRTIEEVRELVRQANDIYRQVGVTLDIGDRISITNIPKAYNILFKGTSETMWNFDQLVNTHSNTGGLEIYFVNRIDDGTPDGVAGAETSCGIVVAANGGAATLAHEIGHAFGMWDIYVSGDDMTTHGEMVCRSKLPQDWSGGCDGRGNGGSRYYGYGKAQESVIRAMLMDGRSISSKPRGKDISYGPVFGVDFLDRKRLIETGFFGNAEHVANPTSN